MIAVAKRQKPNNHQPQPPRLSPWPSLDIPDGEDEIAAPARGPDAVQHPKTGGRGRRSALFPDLNITATAENLGITKSHLAKILSGKSMPSMKLALKLTEVLGKDLAFVAALGHNTDRPAQEDAKPKRKKKH